jgi:hypothetical protein
LAAKAPPTYTITSASPIRAVVDLVAEVEWEVPKRRRRCHRIEVIATSIAANTTDRLEIKPPA